MIINGKRALAYIVNIDEVKSLPNYDRVVYTRANGWWCITPIGVKAGDKAVYFEIDSLVPSTDERFAFLEKRHYKIKTLKMCGVYSQGLLIPIDDFPELKDLDINTDVTDMLGIKYAVEEDNARKSNNPNPRAKYDSMVARNKKVFNHKWVKKLMKYEFGRKILFAIFGKKSDNPLRFPTHFPFVHKTDEERIENCPQYLGYKNPLIVTEKLDGTSSTYILERKGKNKFEFYVLSRNVRQKTPDQSCYHDKNIYWDMAIKYDIENKLKKYLKDNPTLKYVCIQGESVGSVQGNPLKLKKDDLYVFNFIRSDIGRLDSKTGKELIESWGMNFVPILDYEYYMPDDMEEFKKYASAQSVVNPNVMREGVVLRDPKEQNVSFKNVSREYLLKHNQ